MYLTAHQRLKHTLQEEKDAALRRAELIVASAPVALIMCGETGHIAVCNPKAEQMFGWTHDELVGQHIRTLMPTRLHAEHDVQFDSAIKRLRDKAEDWIMAKVGLPTVAVDSKGEEFPVVLNIRMIKYGGKIEFITSIKDMREGGSPSRWEAPLPPPQLIQQSLK
jgi:PAS domain S-box-containing protein